MKFKVTDVERFTCNWEPLDRPHCSNCLFAKVSGPPSDPVVRCAKGHGKGSLSLAVMIRPTFARQFTRAKDCADFEDMGPAS
jgi:hypothetical protein